MSSSKSKNRVTMGKGGNLSSRSGPASEFQPGVYSLKSDPVAVGGNSSQVMDPGMGTTCGGDALGGLRGSSAKNKG